MTTPDAKPPEPIIEKSPPPAPVAAPPHPPVAHPHKPKPIKLIILLLVLAAALIFGLPWFLRSLHTVSTDDAYVSSHVTFVAPRVPGQVTKVYVDDNNRVHKGDLLFQLDPAPYQAQVDIQQSAVTAAESDLTATQAQVRGLEGQTRALRYALQHAIEDVDNQIALLHSKVATLGATQATLDKANDEYSRALKVATTAGVSADEIGRRKEAVLVAQAEVEEALQSIYQTRVSLGLPAKPETGTDLTQVPDNIDQNFSAVKQAQSSLIQSASQLGVVISSFNLSPKEMIAEFYRRDPGGDIDKIYAQLVKNAPGIKQAEAKVAQARANLAQAQLNLSYCDIRAEIDGVISRREINPGNNVIAGQSVMTLRSVTDIWVDANFKETQLRDIRIGQIVDIDVDMYGSRKQFKGRVSGFTFGTGSTLALLPAENATGNFVKVVQRLPVRIDLIDYNPDKDPLFVGLSVTPSIDIDQTPTGDNAGKILQPYLPTATQPATAPTTAP